MKLIHYDNDNQSGCDINDENISDNMELDYTDNNDINKDGNGDAQTILTIIVLILMIMMNKQC